MTAPLPTSPRGGDYRQFNRLEEMEKYIYIIIILLGIVSCNNEEDSLPADYNPIPLRGIRADIDNGVSTRAVAPLVDSIGKYNFLNTDEIIFTKIERTRRPIRPGFSYDNVRYSCSNEGGNVSWKREVPETDIFWSDGSEPHTFIGYILPHEDAKSASASGYDWDETNSAWRQTGFDWHYDSSRSMYYGSIGNPANPAEVIDYTATPATGAGEKAPYDLEKLRKEDLLLTYSTEMQNEDAMAWVHFHHGLASIRVVVTITGFSSTGTDPDAETRVTDMLVHGMRTMYKWDNQGYKAAALVEGDNEVLASFNDWGGTAPLWNQIKDMKLWQSREYYGSGASRTFTFYGIVAPGMKDQVDMTFDVSYPDPLDPTKTHRLGKKYSATLKLNNKQVEFRPGYCTSITINLNHKDEKMTVGAEYMSWQLDKSPDEGSLRKNSTHLTYTDRSKVTIVGDQQATADDATWLYEGTTQGSIYDIYGNDGSLAKPYLIKTADQLLSFAYEVKNGRDFVHKYIKLDADITMQPTKDKDIAESKRITWIGIGDATHKFNGFFLGSGRYINNLYGEHFFHTIGENAVIDKLNFGSILAVQGCGVIAHQNEGLICGCYIDGDVKETDASSLYTGSIVGTNNSFIIACAHVGNVEGRGTIGGLVGFNNGTVMASYHAGEVSALDGSTDIHATVGKRGDGTNGTNNSIMFSCYYDSDLISHVPTLVPGKSGYPLSTAMMQSNAFVTSDRAFDYNSSNKYSGQSKNLRQVVLEILDKTDDGQTNEALLTELLSKGVTSTEVYQLFSYHFSLDEAIRVFTLWLNNIAAEAETKSDDYTVQTNCHKFTKLQILFLQKHYSDAQHRFFYTPATYPKVQ